MNEKEKERYPSRKGGIISMMRFDSATSVFLALFMHMEHDKNIPKI